MHSISRPPLLLRTSWCVPCIYKYVIPWSTEYPLCLFFINQVLKRRRKEILHTTSSLMELSITTFLLQIHNCVVPLIFSLLTDPLFCLEFVKITSKLIKMRPFRVRHRAPRSFLLACIACPRTKITCIKKINVCGKTNDTQYNNRLYFGRGYDIC